MSSAEPPLSFGLVSPIAGSTRERGDVGPDLTSARLSDHRARVARWAVSSTAGSMAPYQEGLCQPHMGRESYTAMSPHLRSL
jgi:hypothetical protein